MIALAAALLLQPPPAARPEEVCLTNACAPASAPVAAPAVVRDEPAIAAAIRAGDIPALVKAGGTAAEGASIMRASCDQPPGRKCSRIPKPGTEQWSVGPTGMVFLGGAVDPEPFVLPNGETGTGGSFLTTGIPGVEPRADMRRPPVSAPAFAATPITESAVQPDGRTLHVVTGWRQPDGRITRTPNPNGP